MVEKMLIGKVLVITVLFSGLQLFAENPIVQTEFTADPAPMVYNDRVYCYTSHDEDELEDGFFTMKEWMCYSTADMVNWQSHGAVASLKDFSWAGSNGAWAIQCIERNGKFYMYCPIHMKGIGVLVADSPTGPFTDPLGKPLLPEQNGEIDPTAFIDDDGQAYLYWGNPTCKYVKLNEDMISYSGGIKSQNMTTASFGVRTKDDRATSYEEGPWFYKRDSQYYLVFAGGPLSEHIAYSTSSSPEGPWKYGGVIMSDINKRAFTNHPGVCDYKGNSYLFYHNQALSNDGFKRSVCVEEFTYGNDGKIPAINSTESGPKQIGSLNPYDTVQAETICLQKGVEIEKCDEGGTDVGDIQNGEYIKVKGVDFERDGAKLFEARVASNTSGGKIELRLDGENGELVGICDVEGTGGWQNWVTKSCSITGATGKHDLYLKFTGGSDFLFNINWWKFTPIKMTLKTGLPMQQKYSDMVSVACDRSSTGVHRVAVPQGDLKVRLIGVDGREVATLHNGDMVSNSLFLEVGARQIRSGVYLLEIVSENGFRVAEKLIIR